MKYLILLLLSFSCSSFLLAEDPVNCSTAFQKGLESIDYYTTKHGGTLRYAFFESPVKNTPKKTFVFIQGRCTFIEFYEVMVLPLLERGFDVWTYDLTGQGGSSRILSEEKHDSLSIQYLQHMDDFGTYVEDIHSFLLDIVFPNTQGKLVLGGYSTGGHLALRYAQSHPETSLESIFVISPLIKMKTPIPPCFLHSLFSGASWIMHLERYVPGAGHEEPIYHMAFEGNPYSGDKEGFNDIVALCTQYPALMMGGASMGWVKAALKSVNDLWKRQAIESIQVPVLIATGGEDGVVDITNNGRFAKKLKHAKHVYYPEGRHELFRETDGIKAALWKDFDQFQKNIPN